MKYDAKKIKKRAKNTGIVHGQIVATMLSGVVQRKEREPGD